MIVNLIFCIICHCIKFQTQQSNFFFILSILSRIQFFFDQFLIEFSVYVDNNKKIERKNN